MRSSNFKKLTVCQQTVQTRSRKWFDVSQDADSIDNQESVGVTFDPKLDLNEELQAGYKILTDLMAHAHKYVNWPFMESLETTDPELYEEYQMRIEKPMWLKLSRFFLKTD